MDSTKYLYHYTAEIRWEQIKESGFLKLTPSNLLKPKNVHKEYLDDGTYTYADETDSIKPVVWLTNSESPLNHGLNAPKEVIQIAIPFDEKKHLWWVMWQDKNRMDKKWFNRLTRHGERYSSWYVCEEIIPINEIAYVKNLKTNETLYEKSED